MARTILGRNVRIGRPLGISRLPSLAKGAAFTSAVGLLIYPQLVGFEENNASCSKSFIDRHTWIFSACWSVVA